MASTTKFSEVFKICNAYESGVGHGFQNDGHKTGPYSDDKLNEAYELGYEFGLEKYKESLL